jgi:hypothetical protein
MTAVIGASIAAISDRELIDVASQPIENATSAVVVTSRRVIRVDSRTLRLWLH